MISRVSEIVAAALPAKCNFSLEVPPDKKFGDLATNAALVLAKKLNRAPRELAAEIAEKLDPKLIAKTEIAGPGFLNLFLQPTFFHEIFLEIEAAGDDFGKSKIGRDQKVLLEFISANPTGPLTIANGRGGFGGDVLARVLARAGFVVAREFYLNDAGNQIAILGRSIRAAAQKIPATDEDYRGKYISELVAKFPEKIGDDDFATGKVFAEIMLANEIEPAVAKMGIKFDRWFRESELRGTDEIDAILDFLKKKKLTYEKDGAIFLRTSQFGDERDRVIIKSAANGGGPTYILPDLIYHKNKFERGFTKLIDIFGADHHGYVPRLKIGVKMLGFGEVEVIITQLVKLFRDGAEMKMSKRAGNFELMSELIDEVGVDSARWFFVARDWNTHLNFDLDLAKKQSADNPVFYVQYAHTRLASILAKAGKIDFKKGRIELLTEPSELALIKKLAVLPNLIAEIVQPPWRISALTIFARELAETFHQFYESCRVIDPENLELTAARLRLVTTTKTVLKIILTDLIGVSAPTKM